MLLKKCVLNQLLAAIIISVNIKFIQTLELFEFFYRQATNNIQQTLSVSEYSVD